MIKSSFEGAIFSWQRGFVVEVECAANFWLAHQATITAANPIGHVKLTTWPGCQSNTATGEFWLRDERSLTGTTGKKYRLGVPHTTPAVELMQALLRFQWPHIYFTLPPDEPERGPSDLVGAYAAYASDLAGAYAAYASVSAILRSLGLPEPVDGDR